MMYETRAIEHGGRIKQFSEGGYVLVDFSASINPLPPLLDLSLELSDVCFYPDDEYSSLKRVIAAFHGCTQDQVAVGNGSVELIRLICMMALQKGDLVCTAKHTFGEYEMSARLCGADIVSDPLGAQIQFICNPENPSGELQKKSDLIEYISANCQDAGRLIVVVDEAFIDLADPAESVLPYARSGSRLIVLRSLTKSFGMPGIRFGYAVGDPVLIKQLETLRSPWSVNALSEKVAIEAFSRMNELKKSRKYIANEREFMIQALERAGLRCSNAKANYVLIHANRSATQIYTEMMKHGFLVRDCTSFGLSRSIRVAVRLHEENVALLEALIPCMSL
jgi:threonine-phosphate decarboxylase